MTKIKVYPGFSGSQEFYEKNLGGRNIFRRTNLYQLLGVEGGEKSKAKIIKAYRQKGLTSHPDKVPGASREEWEKIEDAYNILANGENNRIYHDNYFVKG
jgi:DnaJ-class molecular chaperone